MEETHVLQVLKVYQQELKTMDRLLSICIERQEKGALSQSDYEYFVKRLNAFAKQTLRITEQPSE